MDSNNFPPALLAACNEIYNQTVAAGVIGNGDTHPLKMGPGAYTYSDIVEVTEGALALLDSFLDPDKRLSAIVGTEPDGMIVCRQAGIHLRKALPEKVSLRWAQQHEGALYRLLAELAKNPGVVP